MSTISKGELFAQAVVPLIDPSNQPLVPKRIGDTFAKFQEIKQALDAEIATQSAQSPKDRNPVRIHKLRQKLAASERSLREMHENLVGDCFKIYQHASQPGKSFVLGSEALRETAGIPEMINFGVLSGHSTAAKSAVIDSGTDLKTGGVLCDGSWSVFKNDCVMLSVIHNLRTCFISRVDGADPSNLHNDLFDATAHRPKVMGREIAMLYTAGYRQVANDYCVERYGHMFVPLDRSRAQNITLPELIAGAAKANTLSKILTMLIHVPDAEEDRIITRAQARRLEFIELENAKAKDPANEIIDPEMEGFNVDLLNTAFFEDDDEDCGDDMSLSTLTPASMRSMELSPAGGGSGKQSPEFYRAVAAGFSPILPREDFDPEESGGVYLAIKELGQP